MRRKLSKRQEEGDVDLTPMLDIVFIMLIFFIVTATFVQEKGIDILRPDETEQPQQPTQVRSPVAVQIARNNDVFIGVGPTQRRIDLGSVRANVERALVEQQTNTVVITAHPEADVETTVSVVDQSRQAGASISLRPGSEE